MSEILGALLGALVILGGLGGMLGMQQQAIGSQKASVAAGQLQQIASAAQAYVQANAATIEQYATATTPLTISVSTLEQAGYLSLNVGATNPYGQTWTVQVLQPTANVLQALVLSTGGTAIPATRLAQAAVMAGAQGGTVQAGGILSGVDQTVAQGAYGGWQVSLAHFTNPGAGHLAALVSFNNAALSNNYLYRMAVPGQPSANTMQTALNMGYNDVTNANNVGANNVTASNISATNNISASSVNASNVGANTISANLVTLPEGNSLKIGNAYYYGDHYSNSAVRSGTFYVQSPDGSSPAPIDVGSSTVHGSQTVDGGQTVSNGLQVNGGETVATGNLNVMGGNIWVPQNSIQAPVYYAGNSDYYTQPDGNSHLNTITADNSISAGGAIATNNWLVGNGVWSSNGGLCAGGRCIHSFTPQHVADVQVNGTRNQANTISASYNGADFCVLAFVAGYMTDGASEGFWGQCQVTGTPGGNWTVSVNGWSSEGCTMSCYAWG